MDRFVPKELQVFICELFEKIYSKSYKEIGFKIRTIRDYWVYLDLSNPIHLQLDEIDLDLPLNIHVTDSADPAIQFMVHIFKEYGSVGTCLEVTDFEESILRIIGSDLIGTLKIMEIRGHFVKSALDSLRDLAKNRLKNVISDFHREMEKLEKVINLTGDE